MYSEIKHIFFSTMSNPELFLIKDGDDKQEDISINLEIVKIPTFKFQETVSKSSESHSHHQDQDKEKKEQEERRIVLEIKQTDADTSSSLREEEEQLEDGFRTPTSLDHRIPAAKQCPPAPRKPKASRKRKPVAQTGHSCTHPLDLSKEVDFESLFPIQHNPLSYSSQNAKKVRRECPK